MRLLKLTYLIFTISMFMGCSKEYPASMYNSTGTEINIMSILVNKNKIQFEPINIPTRTSKTYPLANLNNVNLKVGDNIFISVKVSGNITEAECIIPESKSGVCVLMILYSGTNSLMCGFDCYDGDPFA